MALRDFEGWDQYPIDVSVPIGYADARDHGWSFNSVTGVNTVNGYLGGAAIALTTLVNLWFGRTYNAQATWIVGFWLYTPPTFAAADVAILGLIDSLTTCQVGLLVNAGVLKIGRNFHATILQTGTTTLDTSTWYHIAVKVTVGNSGSWEVRIFKAGDLTETVELSGTGDTQQTGNAFATDIYFYNFYTAGTQRNLTIFDHIYICDGTGATYNTFLGRPLVKIPVPIANGTYANFTPSVGTNWSNVDERVVTHQPTDNDYNYSTTSGHKDSFQMEQLNYSGAVHGLKAVTSWRVSSGTGSLKTLARVDGTDYEGAATGADVEYRVIGATLYSQSPKTTNNWTISEINASEFGYQNNAGVVEARVSRTYIQVLGEFAPPVSTAKYYGFLGRGAIGGVAGEHAGVFGD